MKMLERLAQRRESTKGFTLVELLIVIAIIGILATVLIVAVNPAKQLQKSRDAGRKAALKNVQSALEQFYADTGAYPATDCWSGTSGCWRLTSGSFLGANAANYIKTLPTDSSQAGGSCNTSSAFGIMYDVTSTGYTLGTRLENTTDPQAVSGSMSSTPCHNNFNYTVTNQQ